MPDRGDRERERRELADEQSLQVESRGPGPAATETSDYSDGEATVRLEAESHGSDRSGVASPSGARDPTDGVSPSGAPSGESGSGGSSGSDENDGSGH